MFVLCNRQSSSSASLASITKMRWESPHPNPIFLRFVLNSLNFSLHTTTQQQPPKTKRIFGRKSSFWWQFGGSPSHGWHAWFISSNTWRTCDHRKCYAKTKTRGRHRARINEVSVLSTPSSVCCLPLPIFVFFFFFSTTLYTALCENCTTFYLLHESSPM